MKNRRNKNQNMFTEPKYIFMFLFGICILLLLISFAFGKKVGPIKKGVSYVVIPMQKSVNSIGVFVNDMLQSNKTLKEFEAENERLKQTIYELEKTNKIYAQDIVELERLRKLYDLDEKYPSYDMVGARVIAKEPGNWYNVFQIDKGSEHGLKVNMNVLAGNGLVGIITEVGPKYSTVTTIIDDKGKVSGMFLKSSDLCIVKGSERLLDKGIISVEKINIDADVQNGDEIVTSPISSKYLQGIVIGYLSDVQVDSNNLTKRGYLTPVVDFKHLDEVLVITQLKQNVKGNNVD